MTDRISPERRSANMAQIRSKDTKPELTVRRLLHKLGYRFRIHYAELPGRPDIVFTKKRSIIFVHGCFWHRHQGCKDCTIPRTRQDYWLPKFSSRLERDKAINEELTRRGWSVNVIWDCETRDNARLQNLLEDILRDRGGPAPPTERVAGGSPPAL